MRFLIDADLPRSAKPLLEKYGHEAFDVRDIGLGGAVDSVIAQHARDEKFCLLTGDFGFADIRNYDPATYFGIVVLELPRDATATVILRLIEEFLQEKQILAKLKGRLAIVEFDRVRLRPP